MAILLATVTAALPALGADLRRVEAAGAVGLDPAARWTTPPRDAALRSALFEAVAEVARAEAPDLDPEGSEEILKRALGDDPFVYATRFRIVEDRGERPALLARDPGVEREYQVVVEAYVDADRVRESLAGVGLLDAPSGDRKTERFELIVTGLDSYDAYAAVRTTLVENAGADSATPLELSRGRAVFEVESVAEPPAFYETLLATSGPELRILPVDVGRGEWGVRVEYRGAPAEPAADAFDTPGRNRY